MLKKIFLVDIFLSLLTLSSGWVGYYHSMFYITTIILGTVLYVLIGITFVLYVYRKDVNKYWL